MKDPQGNTAIAAAPFIPFGPIGWAIGGGIVLISTAYLASKYIDSANFQAGTLQDSRPYEHASYPNPVDYRIFIGITSPVNRRPTRD